jgi:hypothetical protein
VPDSYAESSDGVLLIANGVSRVLRWDGYDPAAIPAGVDPPLAAPSLAFAGSGPITGQYQAYVRFVDRFGNVSDLSPVSGTVQANLNGSVAYTGLAVPTSGRVVRRQILRNTAGQATTYYVDIDTSDTTSTALTSVRLDQDLLAQQAVPLFTTAGEVLANRYAVPPNTKPYLAFHLTRMWAAGEVIYAEGSAAVVAGSATVAGAGTEWTAEMRGRLFHVSGAARPYEVAAVDVPGQTLTLDRPWGDQADPYAAYAIRPYPGESSLIYFSEAGLPEAWPATNALPLPVDNDTVTGLMSMGSFLYVLKRRRCYRITAQANPARDAGIYLTALRGCVNHRCWAIADAVAYMLDEGGVHAFDGSDQSRSVSDAIQPLFQSDWPGPRINWSASRFFHAVVSTRQGVVRWFVCLAGDYLPRHALCFAYAANKWWVEEFPTPIGSSTLARLGRSTGSWSSDQEEIVLGTTAGRILASGLDVMDLAVPSRPTRVGTGGTVTLTDAGAVFPRIVNSPVVLTDGRGAGQARIVVAVVGGKLVLDRPWAVKPDRTSLYLIGGIRYRYVTGRFRYLPSEDREEASVEILHTPSPAASARFGLVTDFNGPVRQGFAGFSQSAKAVAGRQYKTIDLSRTAGAVQLRFDRNREQSVDGPRFVQMSIDGVSADVRVTFGEMLLKGVV